MSVAGTAIVVPSSFFVQFILLLSSFSFACKRCDIMWRRCLVQISGVQRSGDARGDFLVVCPPTKFQYLAVAHGGHCFLIYAVCDVTAWGHVHFCKPTIWRSLL